jgi:hypothetical protein
LPQAAFLVLGLFTSHAKTSKSLALEKPGFNAFILKRFFFETASQQLFWC